MAKNEKIEGYYAPNGSSGTEGIVSISEHENDKVKFYPMGGGPLYSAPSKAFLKDFAPLSKDAVAALITTYEKAPIWGDWFDEDASSIPGFVNARRWNGWLCPAFEKSDIDAAIEDDRIANLVYIASKDAYASYMDLGGEDIPEGVDLVAMAEGMTDDFQEFEIGGVTFGIDLYRGHTIKTANGPVTVYSIGESRWCWTSAPEPETAPTP